MSDILSSVVGSFFYGEIDERAVFPFPSFTEDQTEMAKAMTDAVSRFGEDAIDGAKMDETCEIPKEVMQGLAELGLCGLGVPEEHGGMGLIIHFIREFLRRSRVSMGRVQLCWGRISQ